jgi:hypothetical protein
MISHTLFQSPIKYLMRNDYYAVLETSHSHSIVYEAYNVLNSHCNFVRKNLDTVTDTVRKSRF